MELELDILKDEQLSALCDRLTDLRYATNAEYLDGQRKMKKLFDTACSLEENDYLHEAQAAVSKAEHERMELLKKYGKEKHTTRQIMNAIHSFNMTDLKDAYEKCRVARSNLDKKIEEIDAVMDERRAEYRLKRMNIRQEYKVSLAAISSLQVDIAKEQLKRILMKKL